jgi:nicotinamidase-related amidase
VVIPNLRRLITVVRQRGLRVIYVTSGATVPDFSDLAVHFRRTAMATNNRVGTREHEIRDEVRPEPGDIVINKSSVSAMHSSNLDSVLRANGIECVLFAGVSTNTCVDTTARDAAERGYKAMLVADCCSAAKPEYHEGALVNFQRLFGRAEDAADIIAELAAADVGGSSA